MGRWSVPVMRSIASSIVQGAGGGAIRPSPSLSKTDANKAPAGRRRGTARTFRALTPGDCRARYLCTSWKRDLSCSTTAEASCSFARPTNAGSSEAEPVRERSASVTRDGIEIRSGGLRCEPDSVLAASDSSVEGSTITSRFSLGLRRRMLGYPPDLLSRMLAVRAEASPRDRAMRETSSQIGMLPPTPAARCVRRLGYRALVPMRSVSISCDYWGARARTPNVLA